MYIILAWNYYPNDWNLMLFTEEVKKEQVTPVKKEIKNDSDSEDEGKKDRQRFKSERPKEAQFKIEKHEQSMWNLYQKWFLFFFKYSWTSIQEYWREPTIEVYQLHLEPQVLERMMGKRGVRD